MKLPIIDCGESRFSDQVIATALDEALSNVGFAAVRNLGISSESLASTFEQARLFFEGDDETKRRCAYRAAAENFGYQGLLEESLDPAAPADLKESFTMRNLQASDKANPLWPNDAFRERALDFHAQALAGAQRLQRLLSLALGLDEDFFVRCHTGENITLRLLHYPPIPADAVNAQQMGAGAHTDYGLLTLLMQDAVGGLEVQTSEGDWSPVTPVEGTIVLNSGDLLERWTNGRYRSTRHRVRPRSPGQRRYSIALFVDPDSATLVEAIPSCVPADQAPRFPPTTAGKHVQEKIEATHGAA